MNQTEFSQSILNELYVLPEDKKKEVRDFIRFLIYKSDLDSYKNEGANTIGENPRQGWDKEFQLMAEKGDDLLIDEDLTGQTFWDQKGWEWK